MSDPGHEPGDPAAEPLVSILVWLNDDRAVLAEFLAEVTGFLAREYRFFEVVFVDNHTRDGSLDILLAAMQTMPGLRVVRLSRAASFEVGCAAGLEHVIGDYVVLMDPYLDRVEDVPRMVEAAREGFDVVIAERENVPAASLVRRLVFALVSRILGERIEPDQSYFRLFTRRVVTALTKIKHRRRHLRYLNALIGYRQRVVPARAHPRSLERVRSMGLLHSARMAVDLVLSHSATPLRWAAALGVLASAANLAWLLYVLVVALVKRKLAEGWLTTSVVIGTMFLMLFLILTILVEYIARILEEVQERPLYFIELEAESHVATRRDAASRNVF